MVRDGFLAESANINELVEEAEGMKMLQSRYDGDVQRVMSNSFGFGGTNAVLADEDDERKQIKTLEAARARLQELKTSLDEGA